MALPGRQRRSSGGGALDYRQTVQDFSRSLALVVQEPELRELVAGWMADACGAGSTVLIFRGNQTGSFRLVASRGLGIRTSPIAKGLCFSDEGSLARWLQVNEQPLVFSKRPGMLDLLTESERDAVDELGLTACFPMVVANRLTGFVLVGGVDAAGAEPEFTDSRMELVAALTSHAALAFENAALAREHQLGLNRVYRAERLATAGELAAGTAHEIRNPLYAVRLTLEHVQNDYPVGSAKRQLVDDGLVEMNRIDQIASGLLSFGRPAEARFAMTDLVHVVQRSLRLVGAAAGKQDVAIESELPESLTLRLDRSLMTQLLVNLYLNALHAMPDGGTLRVKVERFEDAGAEIRVEDDGCGIAPEDMSRVFDAFYTTRSDGTGLGLSICHNIVKAHAGEIKIQSTPGKGTTVSVCLA